MSKKISFAKNKAKVLEVNKEIYARVKKGLRNILQSSVYCGLCLDRDQPFIELNLNHKSNVSKNVTIEDMMKIVFTESILAELPTHYVCETCKNSLIQAYDFISKYQKTAEVLNDYIDQLDNKITEVSDTVNKPNDDGIVNIWFVLENRVEKQKLKQKLQQRSKQKLICDFCKQVFSSKHKISRHMRIHIGLNKYYSCPECRSRNCIHKKYLKKSLGQKFLKCIDCDYKSMRTYGLIVHVNRTHLNNFPYLCEHCGEAFPSSLMHMIHLKTFHLDAIRCEFCDDLFPEQQKLISHRALCKKELKEFKCKDCLASFDSKEKLDVHSHNHKNKYSCELCTKSFKKERSLNRHLMCHKSTRVLKPAPKDSLNISRQCSICPMQFETWSELKIHLKTHKPNEMHSCSTCNKEFPTRKQYVAHARSWTHMRRLDPTCQFNFKCHLCDYTCVSGKSLENHINLVHFKIKPYSCEKCGKTFTTKTHLKNHLETHEGIRRYVCGECSLHLTSLSGLKRHILRRHSDTKPFPCHLCERSFVTCSERLSHIKTFHAEKNLPCPLCNVKFHTRFNIKCHIQTVHMKGMNVNEFMELHNSEEIRYILRDNRKPIVED